MLQDVLAEGHRLLDDLEDLFSFRAKHKGLSLRVERAPQVPRYAVAVLIENVPDRQIPAQIGEELLGQAVNP